VSAPDITWDSYQTTVNAAFTKLAQGATQDFVGARLAVAQAKLIALGLGNKVSAQSTSVDLLCQELDKVLAMITEAQMRQDMASVNGRFIRTGLSNDGHKRGREGGILHP
jgi:hypothetical protein